MIVPPRPTWLKGRARKEWERLVDVLERIPERMCEPDWDAVALLAKTWEDWHAACDSIRKDGMFTVNSAGGTVAHPAVRIKREAALQIIALSKQLGTTPQSRRLLFGQPAAEEKVNPLTEYLAKRDRELMN